MSDAAGTAPGGGPIDGSANRIAVVTGASRRQGLGAAIVRALAADGVDVAAVHWAAADVSAGLADAGGIDAVLAAARAAAAPGARVVAVEADLSRSAAARRAFDAVEAALGPASILVNNAAWSERGGIDALDAAALDRSFAVNARAPALLARELLARLPAGWGRIVNLTSGQGLAPMPDELAYAMTKGALEALTASLAPTAHERGATVNAVDPGPVDTGWMDAATRTSLEAAFDRLSTPEDVADAITGRILRLRGRPPSVVRAEAEHRARDAHRGVASDEPNR